METEESTEKIKKKERVWMKTKDKGMVMVGLKKWIGLRMIRTPLTFYLMNYCKSDYRTFALWIEQRILRLQNVCSRFSHIVMPHQRSLPRLHLDGNISSGHNSVMRLSTVREAVLWSLMHVQSWCLTISYSCVQSSRDVYNSVRVFSSQASANHGSQACPELLNDVFLFLHCN